MKLPVVLFGIGLLSTMQNNLERFKEMQVCVCVCVACVQMQVCVQVLFAVPVYQVVIQVQRPGKVCESERNTIGTLGKRG